MKNRWMQGMMVMFLMVAASYQTKAQDPITLILKEGVTKVIKAVDLKIQRLQTKTIWLQNAQKAVENTMAQLQLNEISDWVEKQRSLYQEYFDELYRVKDAVAYYHRVKEITERQIALVKEYKRAYGGVQQDPHFTREEVLYIGKVYTGIMEESLKNLDQISLVIYSFQTQMSDGKRLQIIEEAADALQQNYNDLRAFTTQNIRVSLERSKDARDIAVVKALYGIQ